MHLLLQNKLFRYDINKYILSRTKEIKQYGMNYDLRNYHATSHYKMISFYACVYVNVFVCVCVCVYALLT